MLNRQVSLDHPVLTCAEQIGAALDRVADVDPVLMTTEAKASALVELSRAADRVRGLVLKVLAHADDVALDEGARSAAVWLAHETATVRGSMVGAGRLAEALAVRWRLVQAGLLTGEVNEQQARVIVHALDELPSDLDPEVRVKAEEYLAAHFDAQKLRALGRRVLEVVAPDAFDDHERKQLEDEERRARQTTRLTMRRSGDGTTDILIRVSDAVAGRLKTYLEAYAAPRRGHLEPALDRLDRLDRVDPATGERVPYAVLLGQAFCAMLESMPATRLPQHGGSATSVVVTIDFSDLREGLGAAGLDTGEWISAAETMRLACNASILPLVLSGKGQPLHLGRARRLFSARQRLAMGVRDGECRGRGCDIPAAWCEAHHGGKPWSQGGRTDIEDGVLLCSWHHHRAHDPAYSTGRMPNGDVRFSRRT